MKYYLKKNSVFKTDVFTPDFDCSKNSITMEIGSIDNEKKDVYLGSNGVGKSFFWQSFVYLTCLYKKLQIHNQYRVIQRLAESCIGDVVDGCRTSSICVQSSYSPSSLNKMKKGEINLNKYYVAYLGKKAEEILKKYSVTYYSNSPYPSCISFFNKDCSSLSSKDIDYVFWSIYKKHEFDKSGFGKISVKLWVNFSVQRKKLSEFITEEFIIKKKEEVLEKYRHCFAYIKKSEIDKEFACLSKNYASTVVYKVYEKFENGNIKFPDKKIRSKDLEIKDFILLVLIHEQNNNYNYSLQIDNNDIEVVNSGTKCNYIFKCLSMLNPENEHQILIIDEPENSLHMNCQENLFNYIPKNFKLILITHSPSFVLNLLDEGFNNHNLYIMVEENEVKKIEKKDLTYASLDDIAAEYFGYNPIVSEWNKINPLESFKEKNFISVNGFYEKLKSLKEIINDKKSS